MDQVEERNNAVKAFGRFAWFGVGLYILVILWGAVVRMTGSGAGCRDAWPSCNDALIPDFQDFETVIEYVHRVTSGLALLVGGAIFWKSRGLFEREVLIRRFAKGAFICLVIEALIGAVLVKFHLVKLDASVARAVVIALHLANTLILVGLATACASFCFKSGGDEIRKLSRLSRDAHVMLWSLILTGMFGAVTALADTLTKMNVSSTEAQLLSADHFLHAVKWLHPMIAIVTSSILVIIAHRTWAEARPGTTLSKWSMIVLVLVGVQVILGLANIQFVIPYWLQVAHLFGADLLWIAVLLLVTDSLSDSRFWRVAERA